ncbi:hypothetical protein SDJN02_12632, partial [Cucurbita argyrosperma subsp. argyrosperma]|uniref:Late embryogenesis abundant protein 1-like n=2 Tax=Cucurbita TaxID=3660 RepID=A0A6J1HHZ6_CUCMO
MSSMQQSFNDDQTKSLTQARTEEWMEATQSTGNEPRDILPTDSAQAQLSAHHDKQEPATFLQQTGEKMVHMAQDAVDTVKETLGMGDKK